MDIRRPHDMDVTVEHEGTCRTRFAFPKGALRDVTAGTYLEYISEFELAEGASLSPHAHDSHEFYYLLDGSATMTIEGEQQEVSAGDLVYIPPGAVHSIVGHEQGFRALAFAAMYPG
jgi:quercetin dioxygenase-like cupin family protein